MFSIKPIYFFCDFLEFTIPSFSSINFNKKYNYTFNLDLDNSSQWFIFVDEISKTLSYRKVNFKNYNWGLIFSISVDDISFDIFYFALWAKNKANIETKSKIWFYSTFFILQNLWKLNFNISDFYKNNFYNSLNKLHRLDICLDVNNTIEELNSTLFKDVYFFSTLWKDIKNNMFSQTYYIKNPLSSKNRFYIFRIYDKILDTFKKWKNFLFSYLWDYEDVRRIELELRQDSCNMIKENIIDIINNKDFVLEKIFKYYLFKKWNSNLDFFKSMNEFKELWSLSFFSNIKNRININDIYWKLWHIPNNYISMAHWYIKKIYSLSWFDWVFEIFLKSQFDENWKKIIEKMDFWYDFFEKFLNYLLKNNYNKNIIERIYKENIKNFSNPKIKI